MYPILHLGALRIESYALFTYLASFAGAWYLYYRLVHTEHLDRFQVILILIFVFSVETIGGKILPCVWHWYKHGVFPQCFLSRGAGRYFHGVLLSAIAATVFYCKIRKWPTKRVLDYFAISACLMSPLGRIGCFLNACCKGKPTNLPWAVTFPHSLTPVHPAQLYHFFFELFILLPVLLWFDKRKKGDGQTFWLYIYLYSIFRYWVEFVRTNPIAWLGLTHAQLFSIAAAVVSGVVLVKCYPRR